MKYIFISGLFLLIGIVASAQKSGNLLSDKIYSKHADSSTYYKNLWEKSGRMNQVYAAKMQYFRISAMDRSWHIYDSIFKAKKP